MNFLDMKRNIPINSPFAYLQYRLEVLTPLLRHCRVTLLRLYLGIPAVGRFSAEGNLQLGSKVAAEKPTEVDPR